MAPPCLGPAGRPVRGGTLRQGPEAGVVVAHGEERRAATQSGIAESPLVKGQTAGRAGPGGLPTHRAWLCLNLT